MAGIPDPAIQLYITPPGGSETDYTANLAWSGAQQDFTITQNFGRQGDTASVPLLVEHSGVLPWYIPAMSQIRVHDSRVGQTLFGGVVTNPQFAPQSVVLGEWDLQCTDYTFYADKALVRRPASEVQASDRIVVDITNSANCGITAATVADGGYVAPGPDLPEWTSSYVPLSSAWRTLASQMGQVLPYGWYVDEQRHLHFYNQNTALDSGVTFTTAPTRGGSTTEGHIVLDSTFLYEHDATSLANRALVQGGTQQIPYNLSRTPTDQWLTDGYTTQWALRYTVDSGSSDVTYADAVKSAATSRSQPVVLFVGGAYKVVSVPGSGQAPSGAWSVISNSSGGYFLVAAAPPAAGQQMRIWYTYSQPIIARATDQASVAQYAGPNGGIFAKYISDSSLTSATSALARAQSDRLEYAFEVERITFNTSPDFLGWVRAGHIFGLKCALVQDYQRGGAMGIDDDFLCTANTVTFGEGGYRSCQITAVRT